jgi:hypothetical protein
MIRFVCAALLLAHLALAAELQVPEALTAEPGRFVSIPVRTRAADGPLAVVVPAGFTLLGAPEVRGGRALVNLLAAANAPAGEHAIRLYLRAQPQQQATVVVRVDTRTGVELRAPAGQTVVAGDSFSYTLMVTNTGNAPDRFRLEWRSLLPGRLEPAEVKLEPGATAEVVLRLTAQDRRRDTASITVSSHRDPAVTARATIRTVILPFAGADRLDGPALRYGANLRVAYGSEGWDYGVGVRVGGELSDFIQGSTGLDFRPERVSGAATLAGDGWRLSYQGMNELQRVEATTGVWQAYLALIEGGYTVGGSVAHGPWRFRAAHMQREVSTQMVGVSYTAQPVPEFSLTPSLSLLRRSVAKRADFGVEFGLGARLQTELAVASGRLTLSYPFDPLWRLGVAVGSRIQSPFGVRAEAFVDPATFGVMVAATQDVSPEVTLRQRIAYSRNLSFSVGARYRPTAIPLTFNASVGGFWRGGVFIPSVGALALYRPHPWEFGVGVSYSRAVRASMMVRYRLDDWRIGAGFTLNLRDRLSHSALLSVGYQAITAELALADTLDEHTLALRLRGEYERWEGTVSGGYDFRNRRYLADLGISYTFPGGHSLGGLIGFGEDFRWQVAGSIALQGGLPTPDQLVDLFGGRAVGFVEGTVYHDRNRDGIRQQGENALAGLTLRAADREARTDEQGSFRLPLPPGTHQLSVSGLPANFGLRQAPQAQVKMGATTALELPVVTVVSVTGVVFNDVNRTGEFTTDARRVAFARVTLQGMGVTRTTHVDAQGSFFFQNLAPGEYTLRLEPASLPRYYEPTTPPLSVQLDTGPTQRVFLGAAERPREVRRTLVAGELSVIARAEPGAVPPGADVRITAQVQGSPELVVARLGGAEVVLTRDADGRYYYGFVTIPQTSGPIATVEVVARQAEREVRQPLLVMIRPGPLATVRATPGLVAPGGLVRVRAEFLTRVTQALVVIGGEQHRLESESLYVFSGEFIAPATPGSHEVQLWADGVLFATTRFRVSN